MSTVQRQRKLGETVRSLREKGLTFLQISEELELPMSTCYSAMRALKLSKDYAESLKMIVKKRKREYNKGPLQSGGSCCSSSESDRIIEDAPTLQSSSSSTSSPSHAYTFYGSTSTTNQLLHAVNKSIEAAPWHQQLTASLKNEIDCEERRVSLDRSTATLPSASTASFAADTEPQTSFVPFQRITSEGTCYQDDTRHVSPSPIKNNDGTKVSVLEENAENAITQKLTWALEQLESSKRPEEIIQLMNVVASALNILNSLKIKDNSGS